MREVRELDKMLGEMGNMADTVKDEIKDKYKFD